MIVFSILTIYSIVKKYVTINNKEKTANILLLNIFLSTKSDFLVFDFAMKSLLIISFYFRWRMLEDSLTFQLSCLVHLKGKKIWKLRPPKKKDRLAKYQSMTLLALLIKSCMYVIKIVKTKLRKQKLWFLLYIPPLI